MSAHRYERHVRRWTASAIAFVVMGGLAWGVPASAQASSLPSEVQTEPAEVTPAGVKLKGKLNPNGAPTSYYFEYARDTCDEGCTPKKTAASGPLTGKTQQEVLAVEVTGLAPGGYWYELVATNAEGTTGGGLVQFTTLVPVITSLEPAHGPTSGGTTVTIHGEPLENARSVHFGTVEGKILHEECDGECEIVPYRTLVVESPPHVAGTVDVTVETAQGMSVTSPSDEFTYGPPGEPLIESETVSHVTEHDATLQAQINTEGLETTYRFTLQPQPCSEHGVFYCELVAEPIPLPSGKLLGSFVGQSVSLDLISVGVHLRPGEEYSYSVIATSAAGRTEGQSQTFEVPSGVFEPLSTTTSTSSGAGQPLGASGGDQPAGSGGSSSSLPGIGPLVAPLGKTITGGRGPNPFTKAQKLSKALKACAKRPKSQRAKCEQQARKQYPTTASKAQKLR